MRASASSILEPLARAAVVQHDRLTGHRMRVVEGDGVGRWPKPRLGLDECVWTTGILRVERLEIGDVIDGCLRPSLLEGAMPERVVPYGLDLPHSVLAHV